MITFISQLPVQVQVLIVSDEVRHSMGCLEKIFFQEQELLQQLQLEHKIQEFNEHHVLFI